MIFMIFTKRLLNFKDQMQNKTMKSTLLNISDILLISTNDVRIFTVDDEEEISKRLTQLKLSLGLSAEKLIKRPSTQSTLNDKDHERDSNSKSNDHQLYTDKDEHETFSEKKLNQREISNHLTVGINKKSRIEFESTFGPVDDDISKINENFFYQNQSLNNALIYDDSIGKKLLSSERINSLKFLYKPENQVNLPSTTTNKKFGSKLKNDFDNSINSVKLLNHSVIK